MPMPASGKGLRPGLQASSQPRRLRCMLGMTENLSSKSAALQRSKCSVLPLRRNPGASNGSWVTRVAAVSPPPTDSRNWQWQTAPEITRGDMVAQYNGVVSFQVHQPVYEVRVVYSAQGRVLSGAKKLWAHIGHSGWQDTVDMQMQQMPAMPDNHHHSNGLSSSFVVPPGDNHSQDQPQVWVCTHKIPTSWLQNSAHLELQLVFKGSWGQNGDERWDNNGGGNWTMSVDLSPGLGLVPSTKAASSRGTISSLLLRIESFAVRKVLTPEQCSMLRTLAWGKDAALLGIYEQARSWDDVAMAGALAARCGALQRPGLHVVHIAAEMAPIAKVGGLADVVTSLAKAHQSTGTLAEIILPKYDCIRYDAVQDLRQLVEIQVPWGDEMVRTLVWSGVSEGLPVYFVEPNSHHRMFWRGRFYGEPDDAARFLFFSRAALEFLLWSGKQPDVLHVHDWQSAAVAPLLKEQYRAAGLARTGVVLTIHNIAFQGWLTPNYLQMAGLDKKLYHPDKLMDDTRPGFATGQHDINILRGGVVYADKVTTVSPTYAREVFQPHFGMGMQGVLSRHSSKFMGVLNGIDHETWDPSADTHIPHHFGADALQGKLACKKALLQEVGLPFDEQHPNGRPLLSVVSRLTEQKGLHLVLAGIEAAVQKGAQVILLGSAPDPKVAAQFNEMASRYGKGPDARLILRHDEGLSHRIYAAADMILIPSMFEPCGLTQLISLRYGTVPIVRETGGLADTVRDVAHAPVPEADRNGFTFGGNDGKAVEVAIGRAIDAYHKGWDWWSNQLVPRCMRQDWSWSRSAQDYLNIYRSLAGVTRHGHRL